MTTSVKRRREELCDLLAGLTIEQWTAETLCAGWDAGDIAAHLIVREREPWTGPGLFLGGPFGDLTDRRRNAWKAQGRERLIAALRAGPPRLMSVGPIAGTQVIEDWIHEQDVRRGGAGLATPTPDVQLQKMLWKAATRYAARTLSLDGNVVVELTDGTRGHRLQSRRFVPFATPTDAQPDVTVAGRPSELLLYAAGREGADVAITGEDDAVGLLAATARTV
ncbi:MAG TPA: maleylpyruvate isomerase family mycothiol-dependent enzyme [Euzebyales bacterium]